MDVLPLSPEWQMSLLLLMEPAQKVRVWDGSGQALSTVARDVLRRFHQRARSLLQ